MSFPRYPAYKPSGVEWLGEVPEHWEVIRLKNVLSCRITDGPHTTPEFVDEGVPFLSVDAIQDGELIFDGCRHISRENHEEYKRKAWPVRNDILMGKAASTGKIARVKTDFEFSIWSPLALIRIDGMRSSPTFYEQALKSKASQAQIDVLCTSNTQKNISMDDIPRLIMTRPPLPEQEAIATFLNRETAKIDALIAEQQRLIELLQEKRQAVISHAVTKGLNPDAPMKDSGVEWLGEVPEHWEVTRVKAISSFTTSGPRGWSEQISEEGAIFVQSGDLNDSLGVDFGGCKRVRISQDAESLRTRLQPGDIVTCITGAKTGNVAVCESLPEEAYVNQHLCLIRPYTHVNPCFVGLLLKSHCGQTHFALAQYGLKQGLSLENVREAPLPLPPANEQTEIVSYVNGLRSLVDVLVTNSLKSVEILKERRSALISAAVTGQIDVRGLVPDADAA